MASCGACKMPMLDVDGKPRATAQHTCLQCSAWLHSGIMCNAVWQPFEDGNCYFCGRDCILQYNQRRISEHAEALAALRASGETGEDFPPPKLLPVRQSEADGCGSDAQEASEDQGGRGGTPDDGAPEIGGGGAQVVE